MIRVLNKNAAMVEQSTAASHSLAREAAGLNELLSRFKIGDQRAAGPVLVHNSTSLVAETGRSLRSKVASFRRGAPVDDSWKVF
jgi:methyl-accepting chemotaxis protein